MHFDNSSISGDWVVESDHYYNQEGRLYFIFWKMNTFHADISPLVVEKRLYFNESGQIIRSIKRLHKVDSKEEINVSFMDREVTYKFMLYDLIFYKKINHK